MITEELVMDHQYSDWENSDNLEDDDTDNSKYDKVKRRKEPSLARVLTKVSKGILTVFFNCSTGSFTGTVT